MRNSVTPIHPFIERNKAQLVELNHYQQGLELLVKGRLEALGGPKAYLRIVLPGHPLWQPEDPWFTQVALYCRLDGCDQATRVHLIEGLKTLLPSIQTRLAQAR